MIEVIAEHSIRTDLLTNLPVLDAGCSGFAFFDAMSKRGHPVVGLDPAPDCVPPECLFERTPWSYFFPSALVAPGHAPSARLRMTADKQARHLTNAAQEGDPVVHCTTLQALMESLHIDLWDAVKLDIEGGEYAVLNAWPGPVARQVSVEFHEHLAPHAKEEYDAIFAHLGRWYKIVSHEKTKRHCLNENFWDTLLVLRGIA